MVFGLFDSGSGGLSVLRALRAQVPTAEVIYFADFKNLPYGDKSLDEVRTLTVSGIRLLLDLGADHIVSACNSVSVGMVLPMLSLFDLPRGQVTEMVGPTMRFFRAFPTAEVLVLATKATIESGIYQNGLRMTGVSSQGVALSGLVERIETNASRGEMLEHVRTLVTPHMHENITHVVLGCTHFPLIRDIFEEVFEDVGLRASVVDPAHAVVDVLKQVAPSDGLGTVRFVLSQEDPAFEDRVRKLFPDMVYTLDVLPD
jgi:glutamate racemase